MHGLPDEDYDLSKEAASGDDALTIEGALTSYINMLKKDERHCKRQKGARSYSAKGKC